MIVGYLRPFTCLTGASRTSTYDNLLHRGMLIRGKKKKAKRNRKKKPKIQLQNENKKDASGLFVDIENHSTAVRRGDKWILQKGSRVKHGTTTNNIQSILADGLKPKGSGRAKSRNSGKVKWDNQGGVYVGSCYIAYAMSTHNFLASFADVLGRNVLYKIMARSLLAVLPKNGLLSLKTRLLVYQYFANVPDEVAEACGLPVVLNITLREDCEIQADEDFLPFLPSDITDELLSQTAGVVWDQYGSAVVMREIPANWIVSIEHPNFDHEPSTQTFLASLLRKGNDFVQEDAFKGAVIDAARAAGKHSSTMVAKVAKLHFEQDLKSLLFASLLMEAATLNATLNVPFVAHPREVWSDRLLKNHYASFTFSSTSSPDQRAHDLLQALDSNDKHKLLAFGKILWKELQNKNLDHLLHHAAHNYMKQELEGKTTIQSSFEIMMLFNALVDDILQE